MGIRGAIEVIHFYNSEQPHSGMNLIPREKLMRLNRRSFLALIPVTAIAAWSWWFFRPTEEQGFRVTWNGELSTTVNVNSYRLGIDGDVPNPLELKLEELYAMNRVKKNLKIQCQEGWSADVPWEGIPISDLLSRAGSSLQNIAHVTITGVTGYSRMLSADEATNPDFMIALMAAGAPLAVDHGYPARLVAPSRSGLDWVKYVTRITATNNRTT